MIIRSRNENACASTNTATTYQGYLSELSLLTEALSLPRRHGRFNGIRVIHECVEALSLSSDQRPRSLRLESSALTSWCHVVCRRRRSSTPLAPMDGVSLFAHRRVNALAPSGLRRSPSPTPALQDCSYYETLLGGRTDYLTDRVGTALLQFCFLQRQSVCLVISTL